MVAHDGMHLLERKILLGSEVFNEDSYLAHGMDLFRRWGRSNP